MSAITSATFVGRQGELASLGSAVAGPDRKTTTWLVGGEAGVGKTRLLQEFVARQDTDRVAIAIGGCIPSGRGSLPFVGIIEALRGLCGQFEPDEVSGAIRLAPELGLLVPEAAVLASPDASLESGDGPLRLFEAVQNVITRLAEIRPVCLVIEDLHWADRSTRHLVMFLVHNLAGSKARLIGTYRSDEMSRTHPFRPLLAELDRSPHVEHIVLEPFDAIELSTFAASILEKAPTALVLEELAERSGGNAFFAAEILDALLAGRHTVRPELADLILAKVESLSRESQELLRLMSAGGGPVKDELLETVADLSIDDVAFALREAIEHRVIVLSADGLLRFRHALMQEAVYATLLPRERQRAHARYADALFSNPNLSATKASCEAELAWHYREARDFDRALRASVAAARCSVAVLAFSEALQHLEGALELWDEIDSASDLAGMGHVDMLRWTADLADATGDYPRAAQFQRAAIAESGDRPERERALLHLRLGRFLQSSGHATESLAEYERALAAVPPDPPSPERALVLAGYGQQLMLSLRSDEGVEVMTEAIEIARATKARHTEGSALNSLGSILLHNGHQDEGVALLQEGLEIAREESAPSEQMRAYVNLVGGLNEAGNLVEAERIGREGVEVAALLGHERGHGFFIAANLAETLSEMARWDEARLLIASMKRPEGLLPESWLLHHTVDRMLRQGDIDAATRVLGEADLRARLDPQIVPPYWIRVADLSLSTGDLDRCRIAVVRGLETAEVLSHILTLRLKAIERCALTIDGGGERGMAQEQAAAQLDEMERVVASKLDSSDTKSFRIHALLMQARAETALLRGDDSVALWAEVAATWGLGSFAWHRARALYGLGIALLRRGDRAEAAVALEECRNTASEIRAIPLGEASRRLMEQSGLLGHHEDDDAHESLFTQRELDVLRLLAEGGTNRRIGDELFISPKTVSVHLSRIYRKLEVENRTEAAAAARRAGHV